MGNETNDLILRTDTKYFSRIKNIKQFEFTINFQEIPNLGDQKFRPQLYNIGYKILNSALADCGIPYYHDLNSTFNEEEQRIQFALTQTEYHFAVRLQKDSFSIVRQASSMKNFINWYRKFMPMAGTIFQSFQQEIGKILNTSIIPTLTNFEFFFMLTNFKRISDPIPKRNVEVLSTLFRSIPGVSGELVSIGDQDFYRLDLQISRREVVGGKIRNTWYRLEAPFNDAGKVLFCKFQFRSQALETIEKGNVVDIVPFDSDAINDYAIAFKDFLIEQAIEKFLGSILENWIFDTVTTEDGS